MLEPGSVLLGAVAAGFDESGAVESGLDESADGALESGFDESAGAVVVAAGASAGAAEGDAGCVVSLGGLVESVAWA